MLQRQTKARSLSLSLSHSLYFVKYINAAQWATCVCVSEMALGQTRLPTGTYIQPSLSGRSFCPARSAVMDAAHLVCALCRFRFDAASRPAHLHAHTPAPCVCGCVCARKECVCAESVRLLKMLLALLAHDSAGGQVLLTHTATKAPAHKHTLEH